MTYTSPVSADRPALLLRFDHATERSGLDDKLIAYVAGCGGGASSVSGCGEGGSLGKRSSIVAYSSSSSLSSL